MVYRTKADIFPALLCLIIICLIGCPALAEEGNLPPRIPLSDVVDTVDWTSIPKELRPWGPYEGARELPGERLGLTGPIIAKGGGKKPFLLVYDAAGALVGGMFIKDAKKRPEQFHLIIQEAMDRSRMQNGAALRTMILSGVLDN